MRQGKVFYNDLLAGIITETEDGGYIFDYMDSYFFNARMPAISVTLPKNRQHHQSVMLFPFFFNMLSEGVNRKLQCHALKIGENDNFGLLLETAAHETIGAITVRKND